METTTVPGATHSRCTSGASAVVTVITRLAPLTASSTDAAPFTSAASSSPISATKASTASARLSHTVMLATSALRTRARALQRACIPAPTIATLSGPGLARYRAATAGTAPVRALVIHTPSSTASGAPVMGSLRMIIACT